MRDELRKLMDRTEWLLADQQAAHERSVAQPEFMNAVMRACQDNTPDWLPLSVRHAAAMAAARTIDTWLQAHPITEQGED